MFLRNAWYVAAWERDIGDTPYAATILGERVAISFEAHCCGSRCRTALASHRSISNRYRSGAVDRPGTFGRVAATEDDGWTCLALLARSMSAGFRCRGALPTIAVGDGERGTSAPTRLVTSGVM